jgi:hypothetical protein
VNSSFESKGLRRLGKVAMIAVLAVLFASGIAVLSADAETHGAASEDGKGSASCAHAAAAGAAPADAEAAAPCAGKEGGCASCDKAKDCPHAKGEACTDCGSKEKAPEAH